MPNRMKKKLLIINGAGASLEFGIPSVGAINIMMEEWSREIYPLIADPTKGLYAWVREKLGEYSRPGHNNRMENILNFENVLFTMQMLSELEKDKRLKHLNNRMNAFVSVEPLPEIQKYGLRQDSNGDDLSTVHSTLIDRLLLHMREICKDLMSVKQAEVEYLRGMLGRLKEEFDLGVINLNYDNVILLAMPELRTGFDPATGEFDRAEIYENAWNFCYHLHGSVHFDMKGHAADMHRIYWNSDLHSSFAQNSGGRSQFFTGEGFWHLNSNIIAGLDKANQVLRQPFAQYFMQLDRLAYESDAILFCGYGFNDWHLNRIFPFIRSDSSKTRKVVVLDWASDTQDGLVSRHDGWSFGLFGTVPFNGNEMGDGKPHSFEPAAYFKNSNTLEKSCNPQLPLAVWYNGLMQACQYVDLILAELY